MVSESGKLFAFRNSGLFSEYYLSNLLKEQEDWKTDVSKTLQKIQNLYNSQKKELFLLNEDSLEDNFIQPILKELGHTLEPQPSLPPALEGTKRPDLAIFPDAASRKTALPHKGKDKFFTSVSAICEVKRWGRPLDKKLKTEVDPFEAQNPSLQISRYLWLSGVKWGILTDGRFWRLYERESSKRLDVYYEIDLPDLLEKGDIETFKYFALLFRKEAILNFLDKVYQGSITYAKEVGEDLKKNVYEALKVLAEGFLKSPANNLSPSQLELIHSQALIYLYRLLFILYAEDRSLLPLDNTQYHDAYSLRSLRGEIIKKLDNEAGKVKLSPIKYAYWEHLQTLFKLINEGSQAHGIPSKQMYVPPYNGGLFEPEKHEHLEQWKVGDSYLAQVIDLLSRSPVKKDGGKAFVAYHDLAIRDLGSIYEGLLEYRLKITPDNTIDLVTDKGERKATGSYYTPDYIVTYIVENTLGPLVREKKEKVAKEIKELKDKLKRSRGFNREIFEQKLKQVESRLIDEVLSLKVLDPAMGSGHFLVEATDYLARALVEALSGFLLEDGAKAEGVKEPPHRYGDKEFDEDDIRWARREVIEKCIYGVDLNPLAVELAKLSLWLSTVAKDKPLSFLDHHLRCGNSLVGAKIKDLAKLPKINRKKTKAERDEEAGQITTFEHVFRETVSLLLKDFELIESLPSETVEQIKEKEKLYEDFRQRVRRFREVADVWTGVYFGNHIEWSEYQGLQEKLRDPDKEWMALRKKPWFKASLEIAEERHFFHWELEFPEVFYEGAREKENSGFDAVIGNPPYIDSEEMVRSQPELREYCTKRWRSACGNWDVFVVFTEFGITWARGGGYSSLIVPNKLMGAEYCSEIQSIIRSQRLISVRDYSKAKVFEEADVYPIVYVVQSSLGKESDTVSLSAMAKSDSGEPLKRTEAQMKLKVFDILPKGYWWPVFSVKLPIIARSTDLSVPLGRVATVLGAATVSESYEIADLTIPLKKATSGIQYFELLNTGTIDRYESLWALTPTQYIKETYDKPVIAQTALREQMPTRYKQARTPKLIIAGMTKRLEAFLDKDGTVLAGKSTVIVVNGTYDLIYLLSLLNSMYLTAVYNEIFGALALQGGFLRVGPPQVEKIPIRRIEFTTPEKERARLLEKGRALYEKCLAKNDFLCVTSFVDYCLKQKPEQADAVHDLLASLAERMMEMNKEKQAESKSLLEWLEANIGAKVDSLKNKTKIQNYHEGGLEDLLEILKENRKALKKNPASKDFYDVLKDAFQKSLAKLSPLKNKIATTDRLIDLIVYRLYRLTEEEIKIVEGG